MTSLLVDELGHRRDVPHMLREIYAQPEAIRETLRQHWGGSREGIRFDRSALTAEDLRSCERILITASGASRHAGLIAQIIIEEIAGVPVSVEFASEFCNRKVAPARNAIAVFITQSGETGDTTAAQRVARVAGYLTLAITNVVGSTIATQADAVLYTYAGKECAIPATKSFTAQLSAIYLFALMLSNAKDRCSESDLFRRLDDLADVADRIESALPQIDADARAVAAALNGKNQWILLGRGAQYPVAMEGKLKLMETAYIAADAFPAGEFRHGPAAILDGSQVVIGVVCRDPSDENSTIRYHKSLQLIDEVSHRTEHLVLIAAAGDSICIGRTAHVLSVPVTTEPLFPLLATLPLQLLAYHVARFRGLDVDRPRSLVKSVQLD